MRPIAAGLCQYESLYRTELSLYDFGVMNDYLDIHAENQRRLTEKS